MNTNVLSIKICDSIEAAPNWKRDHADKVKGAELVEAFVVRKGMVSGRDTVDLVFKDDAGNTYVALVSGANLKMLASTINLMDG